MRRVGGGREVVAIVEAVIVVEAIIEPLGLVIAAIVVKLHGFKRVIKGPVVVAVVGTRARV